MLFNCLNIVSFDLLIIAYLLVGFLVLVFSCLSLHTMCHNLQSFKEDKTLVHFILHKISPILFLILVIVFSQHKIWYLIKFTLRSDFAENLLTQSIVVLTCPSVTSAKSLKSFAKYRWEIPTHPYLREIGFHLPFLSSSRISHERLSMERMKRYSANGSPCLSPHFIMKYRR